MSPNALHSRILILALLCPPLLRDLEVLASVRIHSVPCVTLLLRPTLRILSALGNVHEKQDDQTRHEAHPKQEWEPIPRVSRLVDDRLGHIWPGDR